MPAYGTLRVQGATLCYKVRGSGPALLLLQGGGGNADACDALAAQLDSEHTIVSYDRRGLLRSPADDPKQPLTIAAHAEDAVALMDELGLGRALIFGSSLGALVGLEMVQRFPARVELLVAHEPTLVGLLSLEGQARVAALRKEVLEISLREGARAGLRRLLAGMGVNRDDREDDCEPPLSSREQSRSTGFLLVQESRAVDRFKLNLLALGSYASRIVPAFGTTSRLCYPAECAQALAVVLGQSAVEMPGGHNGYVLRPRAFAEALRDALAQGRYASQRLQGGRSGIPPAGADDAEPMSASELGA